MSDTRQTSRYQTARFSDVISIIGIVRGDDILCRPFLNENIVVETVITVKEGHKAHDLCTVRHMIRCISPAWCPLLRRSVRRRSGYVPLLHPVLQNEGQHRTAECCCRSVSVRVRLPQRDPETSCRPSDGFAKAGRWLS